MKKKYTKMITRELAAATRQFDEENIVDKSRPLNEAERAQWRKAKAKIGRPKIGKGVQVVSLSLEKGLLERADKAARKLRISRAKLVSRGLESVLAELQ
ncbi:MAG TPA: hypothetical protein VHZ24_00555 [Pirellulales bacterium]|jgi:hypothetical protein|nr:hypothetical protein [Pirellulales bacterium]